MSIENPLLGIFDSGIGGFSVLKEIRNNHNADILYFGDCARAPYGNRDKEEIVLFIKEIISYLKSKGVTHFVSACNSMSVLTTEQLLKECGINNDFYIDMIRSFKRHNDLPVLAKVLLIGTTATIKSNVYQDFLKEKVEEVFEYIPVTLAGNIELNISKRDLQEIIRPIILKAKEKDASHIIYGCTHYPLAHEVFQKCADEIEWRGIFIDPAKYVTEAIRKWNVSGTKIINFETSKEIDAFNRECDSLLSS